MYFIGGSSAVMLPCNLVLTLVWVFLYRLAILLYYAISSMSVWVATKIVHSITSVPTATQAAWKQEKNKQKKHNSASLTLLQCITLLSPSPPTYRQQKHLGPQWSGMQFRTCSSHPCPSCCNPSCQSWFLGPRKQQLLYSPLKSSL